MEKSHRFWRWDFSRKGLERREVEKRFYGGERKRLTASATFLFV